MSIWNALILSARNLVSKVVSYCNRFKACLVRTGFASKSMVGIRLFVFAQFVFAATPIELLTGNINTMSPSTNFSSRRQMLYE